LEPPADGRLYARSGQEWVPIISGYVDGYPDFAPGGRLSFGSNDPNPVPVEQATRVYYVPYATSIIPVFNGTSWERRLVDAPLMNDYTDTSKNPGAMVASACADLFVWNDDGTLRLARGPAWNYNGANRQPLTYVHQFRTNGIPITNGPDQNQGTWVGTIATWNALAASYLRINKPIDPNAIWHVWNTFHKQLIVCRVTPDTQISGSPGPPWWDTGMKTYVVVGEPTGTQCTGGAVPGVADFYVALTCSTFNLGGEQQADRFAMTRNRTIDQHNTVSVAFMWGPGMADFGLSIYGVPMNFNVNLVPPISTMYEG
jgi:hypothetical protein